MDDSIALPADSDEELTELTPSQLIDIVIENEDRVPRNVIDECARRGEAMVEYLRILHCDDALWDLEENDGSWWLQLHAAMILGLIPGENAGLLLIDLMRRMSLDEDEDMQDWLSGYWTALFQNKPEGVFVALRNLASDKELDWYVRANAVEAVVWNSSWQGEQALAQALAWVAELVTDESDDWTLRLLASHSLLDFPRPEYRQLLESLVPRQGGLDNHFDLNDIQRAYSGKATKSKPEKFTDPWAFYEPKEITLRQIRWQQEDEQAERRFDEYARHLDNKFPVVDYQEPYVRPEPKVGRNDPCPCGSGKKYKKCCMDK